MEGGEEVNREKQEVEEMNNRKEEVEMEEAVLSIYRCICQASHPLRIVRVKKMRGSMTW